MIRIVRIVHRIGLRMAMVMVGRVIIMARISCKFGH